MHKEVAQQLPARSYNVVKQNGGGLPPNTVHNRAGFREAEGPVPRASHQQWASHQTVHILFLADDRCLRDYDLVVARC